MSTLSPIKEFITDPDVFAEFCGQSKRYGRSAKYTGKKIIWNGEEHKLDHTLIGVIFAEQSGYVVLSTPTGFIGWVPEDEIEIIHIHEGTETEH